MWHTVERNDFDEFVEQIKLRQPDSVVNVVRAEALVEQKGAFVNISTKDDAEKLYLSDVCIIVGNKLVKSYEEVVLQKFVQSCFVTAESKTADIEKKLVSGVHGPAECIFVILQ